MATPQESLTIYHGGVHKNTSIAILVTKWHPEIMDLLSIACAKTLEQYGVETILVDVVPGTYELPLAAKYLAKTKAFDAIICFGCVIQGETRHFEFISMSVANAIQNVSLDSGIPVIFGVLTPNTVEQAFDRAGGKHGNKGIDCAVAALEMIDLKNKFKK